MLVQLTKSKQTMLALTNKAKCMSQHTRCQPLELEHLHGLQLLLATTVFAK